MVFSCIFCLKLLVFVTRKDADSKVTSRPKRNCFMTLKSVEAKNGPVYWARGLGSQHNWHVGVLRGRKDRRPVKFHISPLKRGQPSCFRGDLLIFGGQGMKIIGFCFHAGFLQFLGVFQVIKANPGFCYENLGKWSMIHFPMFFGLKHQQGDFTIPIILGSFLTAITKHPLLKQTNAWLHTK